MSGVLVFKAYSIYSGSSCFCNCSFRRCYSMAF